METAILFILLIGALCFLMTCVAMTGFYQTRLDGVELQREMTVDQIGDNYLASLKAKDTCGVDYGFQSDSGIPNGGYYGGGQYCYSVTDGVLRVWHAKDLDEKTVLYVKASLGENDELIVSAWRYSEPEPQ